METSKQTFLIIYKPGAAWIEGKPTSEQPIQEHGKYMLGLYQAGRMRFAGPFGEASGGAAVIEANGEDEAKAIADQDPAVIDGIFVYELYAWNFIPWENYIKK